MTVAPGTRLGVYEILGLLGVGGMGEVYEARDTRLERDVAIKALASEVAGDPERLSRFEREAKAVATLNHPNIVTLYGVEDIEGLRFLVMERIRGRALSEIVEPGGLPLPRILEVAIPIAEGLGAAHERGVVHRDLKPGNVMVTEDGRVKILDFGLARLHVDSSAPFDAESATETLTEVGHVFGTIPYIAPEQLKGERADGRADIFAFGAILYEMATGDRPFKGKSPAQLVSAILKEDPAPLEERRPDFPPAFVRIVRRCLEKEPRRRPQSAVDLARELREVGEALRTAPFREVSTAAPLPEAGTSRRVRRLLFTAALLLVAGAGAFFAFRPFRHAAGPAPIRSLAVLPFANLSRDPAQDYFVDGMHDALITELARLGAFDVTSRGSVIRYKGSTKPLKQIAEELGVDALIEGSALRAGNRVRITAQLIRGATDKHLWAQTYDRDLQDVLALLSGVSHAIAGEVQTTIASGSRTVLPAEPSAPHRVRPEAWDAHLRARQIMLSAQTLTPSDFFKVRKLHQRSVELDPEFAEGWTGVGLANLMLGFFRIAPAAEVIPRAREAATKALTLDDRAGGAYGVLGTIDLYFDWNFESAKARLERAVALNPHSLMTRHAWADYLMVTGRFEESLAQVKLGKTFEPASPLAHAVVLFHGAVTHRYEEFTEEGRRSAAMFPKSGPIHGSLGDLLWRQGKYEEALEQYDQQPGAAEFSQLLRSELARAGPAAALKAYADFAASRARQGGSPVAVAAGYAEAGERGPAFEWLEKAYAARTPQLLHVVADPAFDGIRDDPRYRDLIRRIGIPQAGATPIPSS